MEATLRFESMMARLSARFVHLPASKVDSVINEGQRLICQGLGLDRSALFQNTLENPDKLLLTHICQLKDPPADLPGFYQQLDVTAYFPWIVERVKRCETVSISRLGDLPDEAARDRENLRSLGTKSTVVVPLQMEGEWIGISTFTSLRSERDWSEQLIRRFRVIADLFTSVLSRQRADRALQESEQRYRRLFDAGSAAILLVDGKGRILDANAAAEEMYGYARKEFLQLCISDISTEPEKTPQGPGPAECRHRRKNGTSFPAEICVSDFADRGLTSLFEVRDITDWKRIEQEMQVSAARYRSLIETQADVIARSDLQGRLTYVNDAYCRMFGVDREQLIGSVFFPTVFPEDLPISQSALQRIKEAPYRTTTETRHPTANGLRWISWENTAVVDDSGNVLELQGTGRDVTERKQAQEALRESEDRYREFIKLSVEGISRLEAEEPIDTSRPEAEQIELIFRHCRVAECSQALAQMYGVEKEDIIGARLDRILDRTNPDDLQFMKSFVRSGYRVVGSESSEIDAQGNPRHFSRSLDGVVEHGRLVRAWLLQHDTTRQKLAEEGLRQTERVLRQNQEDLRRLAGRLLFAQEEERRRLARELHDDLSQRLAMISVDTENLQQDLADSAESLRGKVQDLQTKLSEIAMDIHGISRRLHPSIIETLGLAKAIASECRNFAQRENIEVQCESEPIAVQAQNEVSLCIFRIVQEGLRNIAKHACALKAQVRLRVEEDGIHLRIADDGIGFNPDQVRKKTGLGLASMDERVRLIQGSVTIDSAPKKGTVIHVHIPLERK